MTGTKGKLGIGALVVAAGAAVALFLRRPTPPPPPPPPPAQESGHGAGIDHAMAAALAMVRAPEGATPCETAYNAFKASYDVSQTQDVKAVVLRLAPRDEFLAKCATLPPDGQVCLGPRYAARHRPECEAARPTPEALSPMVELLQRRASNAQSEGEEPAVLAPKP
jgi:hypothetical protein